MRCKKAPSRNGGGAGGSPFAATRRGSGIAVSEKQDNSALTYALCTIERTIDRSRINLPFLSSSNVPRGGLLSRSRQYLALACFLTSFCVVDLLLGDAASVIAPPPRGGSPLLAGWRPTFLLGAALTSAATAAAAHLAYRATIPPRLLCCAADACASLTGALLTGGGVVGGAGTPVLLVLGRGRAPPPPLSLRPPSLQGVGLTVQPSRHGIVSKQASAKSKADWCLGGQPRFHWGRISSIVHVSPR